MPRGQELKAPLKIEAKFGIEVDQMVPFPKTLEQIDHAVQKGTTWPNNLSGMMQMTNGGLQLVPGTPMSIMPRLNQLL